MTIIAYVVESIINELLVSLYRNDHDLARHACHSDKVGPLTLTVAYKLVYFTTMTRVYACLSDKTCT
jgi:hypothetical protein